MKVQTMQVTLRYEKVRTSNDKLEFSEVLSSFTKSNSTQKLDTQETILDFERSGEIINFDFFLLKHVKEKILNNINNGLHRTNSVNISGKTLKKADNIALLVKDIANYLIFEITETSLVDISEAVSFCNKLRFLGTQIAIDDVNHSEQGLALVYALRPEYAKFVLPKNIFEYNKFFTLISTVMAFSPKTTIVIENIETDKEFYLINDLLPFALMQGYYFDKGETFVSGLRYY